MDTRPNSNAMFCKVWGGGVKNIKSQLIRDRTVIYTVTTFGADWFIFADARV